MRLLVQSQIKRQNVGSSPASPVLLYHMREQVNYAPVAQLERGADLKNQMVLVQIQSGA